VPARLRFSAEHQLNDAVEFASLDLTDLMDLQQTRPTARWAVDGARIIEWPKLSFVAGRLGRDVVVVSGPESSLRWPEVAGDIVETARKLGVRQAYTLAADARAGVAPATDPGTRDGNPPVAPRRRSPPYEPHTSGPTGMQTIVQRALG